MKRQLFRSGDERRRGVALIVVLGFLAIMLMMAVTFLTQARMERMVADVTMDAMRGRQMARTGLNAAMSDYSRQLYGEEKLMVPPEGSDFDMFLSTGALASGEVQGPLGGDNGSLEASNVELMTGEARNWIPRRYLADEDYAGQTARWILVRRDPSAGQGADNPIVGRYAYMCFDMSGGIDANLIALAEGVAEVGNATNRASVRDLGMRELKETADASLFKRLRRGWHGFDSLAELILLTNGRYNGGENQQATTYNSTIYYYIDEGVPAEELPPDRMWGPPGGAGSRWRSGEGWTRIEQAANALHSVEVSDLVPYSLATYRGWEYNPNTAKWKTDNLVAWEEHGTWSESEWDSALGDMDKQFADYSLPDWWMNAVEDYEGNEPNPKGLDYPSPKNVPMINEVSLKIMPQATAVANQLRIDVELQVEVWFPFPAEENRRTETYRIEPTIGGGPTATGPGGVDLWIPMRGNGGTYAVPNWQANPTVPATFTVNYNGGKPIATAMLNYSALVNVTMAGSTNLNSTMPLQINFPSGDGIDIEVGGTRVDEMPAKVLNLVAEGVRTLPLDPAQAKTYYWEVHDPRLNHQEEGAWEPGLGTMGDINEAATRRGMGENGETPVFYCKNAPMTTPLEMGYISTGYAWKTLDFCKKEGADALSRMVTRRIIEDIEDVGVSYTNGTINPNTSSTNVLRAAFAELKIKDDGSALSEEELGELIQVLGEITEGKKITDNSGSTDFTGACMRGVDWIWAKPFQTDGFFGRKWSKNERHRLIERTWGLFNPNNSMFTVLVIGQAIKEGPVQMGRWSDDDIVTGERRAVALVWRDPTPPGLGKPHEMFVRMFKFLDE